MKKIVGYQVPGVVGQFPITGAPAAANSLPVGILAPDGFPLVSTNTVGALGLGIPGAAYNGTTDDRAALNAFITAAAGAPAIAWITGPMLIGSNITTPVNIQMAFIGSGKLKPAVNTTATVNGPISAGQWQIFDISNSGATITGSIQNPFCYANWFGAVADGVTDSTIGLQAIAKLAADAGYIKIYMDAGTYK